MATQLADPYAPAGPKDPYASSGPHDPYAAGAGGGAPSDASAGSVDQHRALPFSELKHLWVKAGGDPQYADIMAHVAISESGDGQREGFANLNSNWDHHTSYTEGGKTYYPEGPWQISSIHGKHGMYDPLANAQQAVALFKSNGFQPWDASRHGGAGGGWGQYVDTHSHPEKPTAPNPKTGNPTPIPGFEHIPGIAVPVTHNPTWVERTADFVENAVRNLEGARDISGGGGDERAFKAKHVDPYNYPTDPRTGKPEVLDFSKTPEGAALRSPKLSKTLQRIGEAADVPTFDLANVVGRAVGGDRTALGDYWQTISNVGRPKTTAQRVLGALNPFLAATASPEELGASLDHLGQYGFNSPQDIAYWESQPGVRARVADAKPQTPEGYAVQLALGMHADLARLKPNHPYTAGLETATAEYFNPSYLAAGEAGGMLTEGVMRGLSKARAGVYGSATQRLANLAADAPLVGNRFTKMGDAFGSRGETWHFRLARDLHNVPYTSQARFTADETFGHAPIEDQIRIVKAVQKDVTNDTEFGIGSAPDPNLAALLTSRVVGNATIADRAQNVRDLITGRENELRAIDPEMAQRLVGEGYFTQQGAWEMPGKRVTDPRFPQGVPSLSGAGGGAGGPNNPLGKERIFDSVSAGQREGMQLSQNWVPAGAAAQHDAVLSRYITLATYMKQLEKMKDSHGNFGSFAIDYRYRTPNGNILTFGKGTAGYTRTQTWATEEGSRRAGAEGLRRGWDNDKIARMATHYKQVVLKEMEDQFRQSYPNHTWDAESALQMPMLRGKAVENSAVAAAIDAHPSLGRMQQGGMEKYAAHTIPDEPQPAAMAWLDNMNSLVRQGILSNVVYHPLFNLAPLALGEGINPYWVARALAIDPKGNLIPQAWIDRAWQYRAVAPKFGSSLQVDPMLRAKLMTVPYANLKPNEIAMKAVTQASKWNQDITFGYFEDRLAAVALRHFEKTRGMAPAAAAREVRKLFGDYENMTPAERNAGLFNWHYFYSWMRGQLRYWSQTFARKPQKIMAPVAGVQTANEQQGDQGNVTGGGLSLRSALNAIHYGWGTDAHGNPRYVALPFPNFRYGTDVARMAGAGPIGDPNEVASVPWHLATTSLPPLPGLMMRLGTTVVAPAGRPEPWNDLLWDKNAPTRGDMMRQAAAQLADAYAPPPIRGTAEAAMQHDPTQLAGAVGPYVYSSPNSSPQSKAAYAMSQDLRGLLKVAEKNNDTAAATDIYDLMSRVDDGDPLAVIEARTKLRALRAELGIPKTRRFTPHL